MSASKIRVIIFKDGDCWVAQGLEHDICVQASNLEDIYGRFEVAVRLESAESGGLDRIEKAPEYFFRLWEKKSSELKPTRQSNPEWEYGLAA